MAKKKIISKILRNTKKAAVRKLAISQGAYDGRFRTRTVRSKKRYHRPTQKRQPLAE